MQYGSLKKITGIEGKNYGCHIASQRVDFYDSTLATTSGVASERKVNVVLFRITTSSDQQHGSSLTIDNGDLVMVQI